MGKKRINHRKQRWIKKKIIFTQHYVSLQKLLLSSKKRSSSESSYVSSSKSMSEIQINYVSTSVQESLRTLIIIDKILTERGNRLENSILLYT